MSEEKYGIEVFRGLYLAVAQVLSVCYRVFVEKAGVWQLIDLKDTIPTFATLDFKKLRFELGDISEPERESAQAEFVANLHPKLAEAVGKGLNLLEAGLDLVEDGYASGKAYYERVMALFAEVKALVA